MLSHPATGLARRLAVNGEHAVAGSKQRIKDGNRKIRRAHEDQTKRHELEMSCNSSKLLVMAGLVPAIHVLAPSDEVVNALVIWRKDALRAFARSCGRFYSPARFAALVNFFSTRSRFSLER